VHTVQNPLRSPVLRGLYRERAGNAEGAETLLRRVVRALYPMRVFVVFA